MSETVKRVVMYTEPWLYQASLAYTLSSKREVIYSTKRLWLFKILWPILKMYAKWKGMFIFSRGTPFRMP